MAGRRRVSRSHVRRRVAVAAVGLLGVVVPAANAGGAVAVGSRSVPRLVVTLSDPGGLQDRFGDSVAVSGPTAVVGADQTITGPGAAYIYERGPAGWPTTPTVTLDDPLGHPQDQFGWSVAISGSTIVVGALNVPNVGAAYIYEKGIAGWPTTPTATLLDPGPPLTFPGENNSFGWSVAISGKSIAVGAWQTGSTGAAYLYRKGTSGWPSAPTATFPDPANVEGDAFGWSVAVSGTTALVGSLETDHGAGAAYLYEKNAGGWSTTPVATLHDPVGVQGIDEFGHSVSLAGTAAAVGTWPQTDTPGAAYVYERGAAGWPTTPTTTLHDPSGVTGFDRFGFSVAVTRRRLVVGNPDFPFSGAFYLYVKNASGWPDTPAATVANQAPPGTDCFGCAVAVSGRRIVVGALTTNNGVGAAYIYRR